VTWISGSIVQYVQHTNYGLRCLLRRRSPTHPVASDLFNLRPYQLGHVLHEKIKLPHYASSSLKYTSTTPCDSLPPPPSREDILLVQHITNTARAPDSG